MGSNINIKLTGCAEIILSHSIIGIIRKKITNLHAKVVVP